MRDRNVHTSLMRLRFRWHFVFAFVWTQQRWKGHTNTTHTHTQSCCCVVENGSRESTDAYCDNWEVRMHQQRAEAYNDRRHIDDMCALRASQPNSSINHCSPKHKVLRYCVERRFDDRINEVRIFCLCICSTDKHFALSYTGIYIYWFLLGPHHVVSSHQDSSDYYGSFYTCDVTATTILLLWFCACQMRMSMSGILNANLFYYGFTLYGHAAAHTRTCKRTSVCHHSLKNSKPSSYAAGNVILSAFRQSNGKYSSSSNRVSEWEKCCCCCCCTRMNSAHTCTLTHTHTKTDWDLRCH